MGNRIKHFNRQNLLSASIVLVWLAGYTQGREVSVSGLITYEVREGIYVNRGSEEGLRQGLVGSMRLDNGRTLEFEVLNEAKKSALLRLVARPADIKRLVGRTVELVFEQISAEKEGKNESRKPSAGKDGDTFVPLLAPPEWTIGVAKSGNVFHGQAYIRQMLQKDNESLLDYSVTHVGSSGSLDRIEGSPWSFEWSGDLAYRTGDAYRYHPDYQNARLDLYLASFQRPLGEGGFFRFGRFLPRELPGIGYVDGLHGQLRRSDHWHLGVVTGFKPDRYNLDPSVDEPLAAAYATFEAGSRDESYYSGTAGLVNSLYKGQADRLALLIDQRAGVGSSFTLYSTAEVDFDVGSAETRTGTRLTRLDVSAVSRLSHWLTVRTGVDHWERPDNRAERDLLVIEDDRLFDSGYWRYWVGSDQALSPNLRLSEEIALIDSPDYDYDPRWRIGLTHTDLLSWSGASATMTVYNLDAQGFEGYGTRFSAYLPFFGHRLYAQPIAGFRMLKSEPQSTEFELTYLSMRVNGRLSPNWNLFAGFTHTYGDNADATLLDLGLRYRW